MENTNTTENILLDEFEEQQHLEIASVGQRFVNGLVDWVVLFAIIFGVSFLMATNDATRPMIVEAAEDDSFGGSIQIRLWGIIITVLAYTLMEGLLKGKTIGKFLTRTRAVNQDGTPITFGKSFTRSLCRIIPFEIFSTFGGNPWHDSITKTMVVKEK